MPQAGGLDLSPKTIARARENLAGCPNVSLICADLMAHDFDQTFDVVYSSLTFMHIQDKQRAILRVASALKPGGRFVLSIDKNPAEWIDMGNRRIRIFPDSPDEIQRCLSQAGLSLEDRMETELAWIFSTVKT